jgi:F-type H+-transporting ATPase subunit alpha
MIDTMIPIGKGQRQLIIGDNGLGKSSLCIDAVINQKGKNVRCVYVLIGQKRSTVTRTMDILKQSGAMAHTTVVVAEATANPGLQYLAPFAGCALADEWMWHGFDTLIIYDDLTTHARTYRELSLLLKRPPGREAYPGDIFYLHSRLLERSTALSPSCGGGTMTALPIIETDQGEIASYIPTNLISITDGQIYLDRKLFVGGFLPAIDVTRSVSRIGGKAQDPRIKEEVGRMKLDYLQYLELEVFTRFSAKLEASAQKMISRGRLLRELLKQDRLSPLSIEEQLAWLVAFNDNRLDSLSAGKRAQCSDKISHYLATGALTLEAGRETWSESIGGLFSTAEDAAT